MLSVGHVAQQRDSKRKNLLSIENISFFEQRQDPTKNMKNNNSLSVEEINVLAEQAVRAGQSGRDQEANRLWTQVVMAEPNHVPALTALANALSARVIYRQRMPHSNVWWKSIRMTCNSGLIWRLFARG